LELFLNISSVTEHREVPTIAHKSAHSNRPTLRHQTAVQVDGTVAAAETCNSSFHLSPHKPSITDYRPQSTADWQLTTCVRNDSVF